MDLNSKSVGSEPPHTLMMEPDWTQSVSSVSQTRT